MRTKKVYIAGKITGRDLEEAQAQFEKAEQFLNKKAKGWQVVNPMKLAHEHDKTYESYMTECIEVLRQCDALYVLTGWHSSRGVMREINCAHANRIPIIWEMENKLDLLVKQ